MGIFSFYVKKKSIKRVGNIPVNNSQNNTQYNSEKTPPIPLKRFNSYLMKKLITKKFLWFSVVIKVIWKF